MPNVLTDLAADIYKAADIVGRERVGFIPSVTINSGSEEAAQGDTVRAHYTRAATVNSSVTPAMTIPEGDDQTIDTETLTLSQISNVQIPWTGEDIKHVNNGAGYETIYGDQIAQAFRGISNAIEAHVATVAYQGASRAVGSAGTAPFGSTHHVVNEARQVIIDNGMPDSDGMLSLVMNTTAGTRFRNLTNLYKVNESGDTSLLRQGVLTDISQVMMRESAQVQAHTKGAGAGYDAAGGEPVGETSIALDGGTVNTTGIKTGDVVTFAGDSNNYVVRTGSVATSGTIVLNGPGLREALADTTEMTIGNSYTANVLLHRSAVELAMRPLEKPNGSDAAVDEMTVQDPHSGLVFRVSVYKGYYKQMIDITALYQAKAWKPDGIALVMG